MNPWRTIRTLRAELKRAVEVRDDLTRLLLDKQESDLAVRRALMTWFAGPEECCDE